MEHSLGTITPLEGGISIKPHSSADRRASEATAMDSILRFGKKADDAKKKQTPPPQNQHGNASKLPRAVEDTLAKVCHAKQASRCYMCLSSVFIVCSGRQCVISWTCC